MRHLSKVVWQEGMYLGPHHFQEQERHFADLVDFTLANLSFEAWGFTGLQLDEDALRNGLVGIRHARGVFADGLTFEVPECDAPPAARAIAGAFPTTAESVTVFLGVPPARGDGANCAPRDAAGADALRYWAEARPVVDDNVGGDEKPVAFGQKNLRLLFEGEQPGWITLPLARVGRDLAGRFIYTPGFIPPALRIGASESLLLCLRRLVEALEEKTAALGRTKDRAVGLRTSFAAHEIGAFWLLHTLNGSLAVLRHLYDSRRSHPEVLYRELSRLAGALCTFSLDSDPRRLPAYEHARLDRCFAQLEAHIRRHLELIVPSNCIPIPLHSDAKYFFQGQVSDQRCLDQARWVLALRAETGDAELIARAPQLVKVCSGRFIAELVRRAVSGLPLQHLPVPPSALSPRVDTQYFLVGRVPGWWDDIVKSRQVGVYIPGELPNPNVELFALLGP